MYSIILFVILLHSITVGSTNRFDEFSYFSNFGKCVDLLAPVIAAACTCTYATPIKEHNVYYDTYEYQLTRVYRNILTGRHYIYLIDNYNTLHCYRWFSANTYPSA